MSVSAFRSTFEKRRKGEVSSKLFFKTESAFCIRVVGKMRKYIFLAFVMLFLKEITTFESEEPGDDRRSFRNCKTCICDQGTNKETYDETSFNGQCEIRCALACANPELRLKMDRSEGNRSRWGQKHDAKSGNFRRTSVLWISILFLLIIAIFTY